MFEYLSILIFILNICFPDTISLKLKEDSKLELDENHTSSHCSSSLARIQTVATVHTHTHIYKTNVHYTNKIQSYGWLRIANLLSIPDPAFTTLLIPHMPHRIL